MSRHGYTEDGEWCEGEDCGECDYCLWRARVDEAIAKPESQDFLAELAKVGPLESGFCSRVLMNEEGAVCAIGAVLKHRGEKLEPEDEDYGSEWAPDEVALLAGIPEELAQEIMFENDEWGGSPEKVRDHMVAWAKARLKTK